MKTGQERRYRGVFGIAIIVSLVFMTSAIAMFGFRHYDTESFINETLKKIKVTRGICVVLGDANCSLSREFVKRTDLIVYVQLTNDSDVEKARRIVDSEGLYGKRIFIEKGSLSHIHLADNVADALIAFGNARSLTVQEALRVIHPDGKVLIGQKEFVKPYPKGVDDWSHPFHSPDNNPQSDDQIARSPYLTQFLSDPRYGPLPQLIVSSAGRIFKAYGHIAFKEREEPLLNTLAAYNGYNGTLLWKREIHPGIMVHRNTMIATPTTLYWGDNVSCKLIDTVTGEIKDEITPSQEIAGGTFWKWMALENGILYALIGEQEQEDPIVRQNRTEKGWPWYPLSPGFNQPENPWGFGQNVLAINPETKKILWHHHEDESIDSRAMCMKNSRIYIFRFGSYLTCLDANNGSVIWKRTREKDPEIFKELGEDLNRQGPYTNFRTAAYLKCSDKALYFAGPMMSKLIVLSTEDGSVLWEHPYSNFQLVLHSDGLYGISGTWGENVSKKFDPLTGKILGDYDIGRRSCTRPTGSADAIFYRAKDGTVRFDLAAEKPQWLSPMRPQCQDGVIIANGYLYWWPSVCDCELSLYGITCLGPAGDFDFSMKATDTERLEKSNYYTSQITPSEESPNDWPSFRKDSQCSATTGAVISPKSILLWETNPNKLSTPTAPVTVGNKIFFGGSDGIVYGLDALTGKMEWKAYTGGVIRIPPSISKGRVYVGSGDGWVYALKAESGDRLWRFRAAPIERKIPVYGSLSSTWPAASGVLVNNGTAYVAAGIANYDGTYVYALNAETGSIKWQNNTSGHLNPDTPTGVSVQGHMLLHDGKLYLAGGNAVSPAVYDSEDGKCLNEYGYLLSRCESISFRGWELDLIGDKVVACGQPFYKHPDYTVYNITTQTKLTHETNGSRDILWENDKIIFCYPPIDRSLLNECVIEGPHLKIYDIEAWVKLDSINKPFWQYDCAGSSAVALCKNAVVVATDSKITALNLDDGSLLWEQIVPSPPVPWGIAVDRNGHVIVSLKNGGVMCFGESS